MDSMNSRYFSWSSLFFPIRGVDPNKFWSWYPDVWRITVDVVNRREAASPDVEAGTTCKSVWAVQCAESQERRRTGGRKRQKSNLLCISAKKSQALHATKICDMMSKRNHFSPTVFCFNFYLSWFVQTKLQDDIISRFSNNVNSQYNLCFCSY